MKRENINSNQILFLSILWGLSLIGLQIAYFTGREDNIIDILNAISDFIPTSITILLCSFSAGMSLRHMIIKKINLSYKQYYTLITLCLFTFPVGLFFFFGENKILVLNE